MLTPLVMMSKRTILMPLFSLCILSFANEVFCSNDNPERATMNGTVLLSKTNASLSPSVFSSQDKDIVQTGHLNGSRALSRADQDKLTNFAPTSMSSQDHPILEQKDTGNTSVELVTVKELKISSPKVVTIPDLIVNPRPMFVTGSPLRIAPLPKPVTESLVIEDTLTESVRQDQDKDKLTTSVTTSLPFPFHLTQEQKGGMGITSVESVSLEKLVVSSPKSFTIPKLIVFSRPVFFTRLPKQVTTRPMKVFIVDILDDISISLNFKLRHWPDHVCGEKGVCSNDANYPCEIGGVTCVPCRCDGNCTLYRDCCLDKYVTFGTIKPLPSFKKMSCVPGGLKPFGQIPIKSYYMVDYCPKNASSGHLDLVNLCETNTEISDPVYSPTTDTHYRNRYCATCNEEKHVVMWQVKVICQTNLNYSRIHTPKSFFDESLTNEMCNVLFVPPPSTSARECTYVKETMIDSCPPDYPDNQTREGCARYLSPVETDNTEIYKNVLCAMCNGKQFGRSSSVRCGLKFPTRQVLNPTSVITNYGAMEFKTSHGTTQCPQTEVFDTDQERCRPLFCPPGKVITENKCLDLLSSAQGLGYTLHFALFPDSPNATLPNKISPTDIFSNYRQYSDYILVYANVGLENSEIALGHTKTGEGKHLWQILNITVTMHIVIYEPLPRGDLERSLVDFVVKGWYYYHSADERPITFSAAWLPKPITPWEIVPHNWEKVPPNFKIDHDHTVETRQYLDRKFGVGILPAYHSDRSAYIFVSEVLRCKLIELTPDEYDGDRTQIITVKKTGKILKYGQFVSGGGDRVRICTDFTGEKDVKRLIDSAVGENSTKTMHIIKPSSGPHIKVTLACTILSQFFLLLTFVVYVFRQAYRDVVGQNCMTFICNVFCLQLIFSLSVSLDLPKTICVAFGVVVHYLWLSSFLWLLCGVLNMCQLLLNYNGRSFRGWIWAVSQGFPLLVLGIYIAISISVSNDVGYAVTYLKSGIDVCFFPSYLGLALSFLSPIGVILCLTICLFGRIGWSLKDTKVVKSQHREAYIGLTMSYLTIALYLTLTWIFTTLMLVINMPFLLYFCLLLHAGVGILVFVNMVNYRTEYSKSAFKARSNSDATFYSIWTGSTGTQVSEKPTV